jgi:uncharacterized protein with PIN domain
MVVYQLQGYVLSNLMRERLMYGELERINDKATMAYPNTCLERQKSTKTQLEQPVAHLKFKLSISPNTSQTHYCNSTLLSRNNI